MTHAMEDVFYDRKAFNDDPVLSRHPPYVTERHFYHQLTEDDDGYLAVQCDDTGRPLTSPRKLGNICGHKIVTEPRILKRHQDWSKLVGNIHPFLLTEALLLRGTQAIVWLVSTWPTRVLRVYDVIPLEDTLVTDYLTQPCETDGKTTLVDCFVLGLLKMKPDCNLKYIDFSGFEKDRKLCRELCRLPVLWLKPEARTVDKLHEVSTDTIDVTKDKIQRFLNRISVVYSNVDTEYHHENCLNSVTVFLDLQVTLDDVPIGLSLQHLSPFRFSCSRLWMVPIRNVGLLPTTIPALLDYRRITHFEYMDRCLPKNEERFEAVIKLLGDLRSLFAVSLPCSVDVSVNPQMVVQLNRALRHLKYLQRLGFSYCKLSGNLGVLLGGLNQRLNYLNLKDCLLDASDLLYLQNCRLISSLRELNLSRNSLQGVLEETASVLERARNITCLSVAYASLDHDAVCRVARAAKECPRIKVLCLQGYTPPPDHDILEVLHILSQVQTLQKVSILPEVYAFPGQNEHERELNKLHVLSMSYRFLEMRKRDDIDLE